MRITTVDCDGISESTDDSVSAYMYQSLIRGRDNLEPVAAAYDTAESTATLLSDLIELLAAKNMLIPSDVFLLARRRRPVSEDVRFIREDS